MAEFGISRTVVRKPGRDAAFYTVGSIVTHLLHDQMTFEIFSTSVFVLAPHWSAIPGFPNTTRPIL